MIRPLASTAAKLAGRRRLRCSIGVTPGLACRRWLSDSISADAPPKSASDVAAGDGRTWTWSTPSPNRPGRGGAEIAVIPRYLTKASCRSTTYIRITRTKTNSTRNAACGQSRLHVVQQAVGRGVRCVLIFAVFFFKPALRALEERTDTPNRSTSLHDVCAKGLKFVRL